MQTSPEGHALDRLHAMGPSVAASFALDDEPHALPRRRLGGGRVLSEN
jgi:hypothetical protein